MASGSFYSNQSDSSKKKKKEWYRGILLLYFIENDHFHQTNFQSHFLYKYLFRIYYWLNIVMGSKLTKLNILRPVLRKITTVVNFHLSIFFDKERTKGRNNIDVLVNRSSNVFCNKTENRRWSCFRYLQKLYYCSIIMLMIMQIQFQVEGSKPIYLIGMYF